MQDAQSGSTGEETIVRGNVTGGMMIHMGLELEELQ